jgi:hypothetical protein
VFFDGQVFDAYTFVSELIRSAQTMIHLIDNYVDETMLMLLTKRKKTLMPIFIPKESANNSNST